ncbi:MAG TPA: hypothetical protein VEK07_14895 [Polyangiaceae bacterium]|nr:hypothetical protein [Polyangiaceae bacterium]
MGIGRATLACVIMGLSACSVAACALLVGPVQGQQLLETEDSAAQAGGETSLIEAAPADAPPEDQADVVTDTWVSDSESAAPDTAPGDVWIDAGPCQIPWNDLITNGDFSMGTNYWALVNGTSGASIVLPDAGGLCVQTTAGDLAILGWTKGVGLPPNSYDFWYCAWTSGESISVYPVVGHSSYPNTQDYYGLDTVTTAVQELDHQFTLDGGDWDDSGGLSFQFTSPVNQQVCFLAVNLSVRN